MKALILGGSYFIGRTLVDLLNKSGWDLFVLNRGTKSEVIRGSAVQLIADRYNLNEMTKALGNTSFDVVFDLSGFDEKAVGISYSLLRNLTQHYVCLSSIAVCRMPYASLPITEEHKKCESEGDGIYGLKKWRAEQLLDENSYKSAPVSIVRLAYAYGPWDYRGRLQYLLERIQSRKPIIIRGSGENIVQVVFVADLVQLLMKIALNQNFYGQTVNFGSNELNTVNEIVEMAFAAIGQKERMIYVKEDAISEEEALPLPYVDRYADLSKINSIISLDFLTPIKIGIQQTIKHCKEGETS